MSVKTRAVFFTHHLALIVHHYLPMKAISILGSTGSIGCNTLKVVDFLQEFRVVALGAGKNVEKLAGQIVGYKPEIVSCEDEFCAENLLKELHRINAKAPKILLGEQGLIDIATHDKAEIVVSATVGAVGLVPTLKALEAGKTVALANKETLVMAGELMTKTARENNARLLPVDSEHNAIHQCLRGEKRSEVKRLILTASGGPFRTKSKTEIENATRAEALNHPKWKMGDKITIDSATLMNKGLEVIEARWLFDFSADEIDVLVHPESIVHSLIELIDGSIIAQLGATDMRHAIQYALTFPERKPTALAPLDLAKLSQLNFEAPDFDKFPALALAYKALKIGGTLPAAMNAANEIAVQAFLDDKIRLSDISKIIESVMNSHKTKSAENLEVILAADNRARGKANEILTEKSAAVSLNK